VDLASADRDGAALTREVIGCAIAVHRELGPGMLESVYEECLCVELAEAGIPFGRQHPVAVRYRGIPVGVGFRIDVLVANELVVEIKAVEQVLPVHESQVLTYLRFGGFRRGLLMNFNARTLSAGLRRLAL
jgi:GxxExxY protein